MYWWFVYDEATLGEGEEVGGRQGLTLNSWDIMGSTSQYRARRTFA